MKQSAAYKKGKLDGGKFLKLLKHYGKENKWTNYFKANPFDGSLEQAPSHVDWAIGFRKVTKVYPNNKRVVNSFEAFNIDDEIEYAEYEMQSAKETLKRLKEEKKKFIYDILKKK